MRLRQMLHSKIHRATVTAADLNYVGSITIDNLLLEAVDLWPGELVHVWNVTNGERFETYALPGEPGSGVVQVNGSAARRVHVGDIVIIAAFCLADEPVTPRAVLVDAHNRLVRHLEPLSSTFPLEEPSHV